MVTALDELVCALRAVVDRHADWRRTARLVARTLERHLPSPEVLTDEQRAGDADGYRSYHCNERAISIRVCGRRLAHRLECATLLRSPRGMRLTECDRGGRR